MSIDRLVLNLGGEGEEPDVINQQGPWVLRNSWLSVRTLNTFKELVDAGHVFLICSNLSIPFPDESVDTVITNNVPLDRLAYHGPGVQSSEIRRILKSGGTWINTDSVGQVTTWNKP